MGPWLPVSSTENIIKGKHKNTKGRKKFTRYSRSEDQSIHPASTQKSYFWCSQGGYVARSSTSFEIKQKRRKDAKFFSLATLARLGCENLKKSCIQLPLYKFILKLASTKGTMDPEGASLLTYSTVMPSKPRLCTNIHHYAPPRPVLQQAGRNNSCNSCPKYERWAACGALARCYSCCMQSRCL